MADSILDTIKKMLGVGVDDASFDTDILVSINSALMAANQIGIGPTGFSISGKDETWADFLGEAKNLEAVKSYLYLKVRLLFDPPASQTIVDAFTRQITELEWRLNIQAEGGTSAPVPPVV